MKKKTTVIKKHPKPMSVLETIMQLRALLAKGWTTSALARNKGGDEVDPKSKAAVTFCMLGGLERVDGRFEDEAVKFIAEVVNEHCNVAMGDDPENAIMEYNDMEATKGSVLRMLDKGVKMIKKNNGIVPMRECINNAPLVEYQQRY